MLSGLPKTVDLYRLAMAGETHVGRVKQSVFKRLVSAAHGAERWVDVSLQFGMEQGVHYLRGGLTSEFTVICQRCMNPMEVLVDTRFLFGFVRNKEEESRLPEQFEPLWVEQMETDLLSVIEDELLLAMPMVALHPSAECPAWKDSTVVNEQAESDRATPFSVLAALTRDKH